jgi:hypothetical protein
MFNLFLNPWFMVAGGVLVSAPIIIHLINRMRFKRIRWAAMEFLLKSQKRNRRRLIIEQLILLALRCTLVLLAGLLVARFVGAMVDAPKATSHLVIIDDTPSMSDHWNEQGAARTSFDVGRQMVKDIARRQLQTSAAQQFRLVRLSQCNNPLTIPVEGRLNDDKLAELTRFLDDKDTTGPTALHVSPIVAFQTAAEIFKRDSDPKKIFYFVSDFRDRDWSGPEADKLAKEVENLTKLGVNVKLVDVANPTRGEHRQAPANHDNLAITDLRPESRVVPLDMPVQFSFTLHNFSSSEKKNVRVTIKVDGLERADASAYVFSVPPGPTIQTFQIGLDKEGFRLITANIEPEDVGLQIDNIRYAVVEVKKQVPILVIDGDGLNGQKRPGGTYFLQNLFSAAKGYQVVAKGAEELEKSTLEQFPCVFLVNIKDFTDKAIANLERYVSEGGGVAFFMGNKVSPPAYRRLYKDGQGIFPAPLQDQPTEDKVDPGEKIMRALAQQPSIFIRNEQHPMFAGLYKDEDKEHQINKFFPYLTIEKFYGIQKGRWNRTQNIDELITLPNRQSLDTYKAEAQGLNEEVKALAEEPKNKPYQAGLDRSYRAIREGLGGRYDQLFQLATDLDRLLRDPGEKGSADRPNLVEFWSQPEQKGLRRRLEQLRDRVQFGEPLALANRFGKGRVVAFLTAIGMAPDTGSATPPEAWNDLPGGPGAPAFVVMTQLLQKYLNSISDEGNYLVGTPFTLKLDATRYEPHIRRFFQQRPAEPPQKEDDQLDETELAKRQGLIDLGEQQPGAGSTKDLAQFTFDEARQPGLYMFHLYPKAEPGTRAKAEPRTVVYNLDVDAESDLKRVPRDALERNPSDRAQLAGTVTVSSPDNPPVEREHKNDLSEMPWFYLIFLVVLVIEQALAVHLSFHLKGNEAQLPAAARTQPTAA